MDHSEVKHLPKVDHTPAELDDASRLLLKAAALIDAGGLSKGCVQDSSGGFCVQGAINWVGSGGKTAQFINIAACIEAKRRMGLAVGMREDMWNNSPERTKEQVVSKMRSVALGL